MILPWSHTQIPDELSQLANEWQAEVLVGEHFATGILQVSRNEGGRAVIVK